MNERIKLLVEQAKRETSLYGGKPGDREFDERFNKMFAELVVAEMLQTCEDHPGWSGRMIGEQIKQHFGVEE